MRKRIVGALSFFIMLGSLVACAADTDYMDGVMTDEGSEEMEGYIVVGFSQIGSESDWRIANAESFRQEFTEANGYYLIFEDAQQKQENQIKAVRNFILQEVDYIVLDPIVESGWEGVLQEARDAGIPVILADRMLQVEDEDLYTCWVGSDFKEEGRMAGEWLAGYLARRGREEEPVNIVTIQGTLDSSAQLGRTEGFWEILQEHPNWTMLEWQSGDFTQAKGREVMESFLKQYDNINVVYCENDNEAFGAIEAIEAAGKKVGSDIVGDEIMVLSFDGVGEEAIGYMTEGKITCIAECNPLHGPRVRAIIELLETGGTPEKYSYVDEEIFSADETVKNVTVNGKEYAVTILAREAEHE